MLYDEICSQRDFKVIFFIYSAFLIDPHILCSAFGFAVLDFQSGFIAIAFTKVSLLVIRTQYQYYHDLWRLLNYIGLFVDFVILGMQSFSLSFEFMS